ncbi:MAG: murein biosynthesis integral membrane protein MurJ [Acidimicrobiia bacterium]
MTEPSTSESSEHARILRSSVVVGAGTALSRATGFLRIAAIAYALGLSGVASVYSYANETPNIVYELLLGGVLTATLVPVFVRLRDARDDESASAVWTVSLVALAGVTVLAVLLAPWIVRLFTLRLDAADRAAQQDVATDLMRLFMPQMFFYGLVALATAMLNSRRRYAAAAFAPILNNVVVISLFLALPRIVDGPITLERVRNDTPLVVLLGLGTTAGIAVMALALLPALARAGIRLRFRLDLRDPAVATILRLSGWTVLYVITNQIALWVVLVLANETSGGPFAYLAAAAFFQLPHGLVTVSLMTTLTPELAAAAGRHDIVGLRDRYSMGLRLAALIVVPAAALYVALSRPIVVSLLERGAFTGGDSELVANTLLAFAVGLVPFSVYLFSLRVYYAMEDTRTPFLLNAFENAVNIALAIPLFAWIGVPGLALAFALAYAMAAVATFAALRRRLGRLDGRRLASTFGRLGLAAVLAAAAAWPVARLIGYGSTGQATLALVAGAVTGAVVYFGALVLLRVEELGMLRALRRGPAGMVSRRPGG